MDSITKSTFLPDGMTLSGGSAPFEELFPETTHQMEPKALSDLPGRRYLENKEKSPKNQCHRRLKCRRFGSVCAILSGIITVAAGAFVAWTVGGVLTILAAGLICSGAGRVIYTGASLAGLIIDARRKGSLRNDWKTFFQCIAQKILSESPSSGIRIKEKLWHIGLQNCKYQSSIEICDFIGDVFAFGGGVTAVVAAVMTGGSALYVTAFAMIMFGAGGVASAAPRLNHLRIKGSLADGVAEMCNFAEIERLHHLTCPKKAIGKNVTSLHKYYKIVQRVKLSGSVLGLLGGIITVAAGAVEVSYGADIIFGAGITVFGSAGVLVQGVSFVACILLRRIKERFRKDWKDCFCRIEKARLFELGRYAKNICPKLREVANTLDRHHQNVQTAKIIGSGTALAGGIAGAAGAVVTLATGGLAAPLVVGGAIAFGAGNIIKSGASKVEEIIETNTLEALQEEWDGFQTLFDQELEALHKKSAMYTAELNKDILSLFEELGSTLLSIKEGSTNPEKTESADKHGGCAEKFEKKMIPFVQKISVNFVDVVNAAVQLDIKRKSKSTLFLLKLANDLEKLGTRLCEDGDQRNSETK